MNLRKREQTGMPLLIAEIGFNHEGNLETAATMIRAAADSGADAVKFQTFRAADLALPSAPHYDLIRKAEMNAADAGFLSEQARKAGIEFFSTPFSLAAVNILESVDVPAYKIASMDVTTPYLLEAVAKTGKPVILSTGMATLDEIAVAVMHLRHGGCADIGLLHCLSLYPAQARDCNLAAIGRIRETFGVPTGWSDHFPGSTACLAAFCAGADIIETHFTLDSSITGGDHAHSLDPQGMKKLVSDMRCMADMQGSADFFNSRPDREFAVAYRRGVYAAHDLPAGKMICMDDLLFCRPQSVCTPLTLGAVLGHSTIRDLTTHTPLSPTDVDE